ncbi:class I SAM-dependent methyltransferase [Saccharopolyspora griseoalba]|uniref:Class I SAM-dependent methyltransferase n=1 Tax=Saccharopolyspora griseoalba TaxID=1431848 RepID=A0ABW2LEY5_9PSEU
MHDELPDFDAVYRGQGITEGADQSVPWNIGVPQPAIAELIEQGVGSPVLDAGCGVGVTALDLAARGHEVVGVDSSETAIAEAEAAKDARHATASFQVADVTELDGYYDGRFSTVIDSTLFHSLPVDRRDDYLRSIARAARDGAVLRVLVFRSDAFPEGGGPNAVTAEELRAAVEEHWNVDSIEDSSIAAFLPAELGGAAHPTDEQGRSRIPAFLLTAHR